MTFKEAHGWCLEHEATVFFRPEEGLGGKESPTIGKVQCFITQGGSAGDTLVAAIENWIEWRKTKA